MTHISLRFEHPSRDLEELANALDLPVSRLWVAGSTRKTKGGVALEGSYASSYLAVKLSPAVDSIDTAVSAIRSRLSVLSLDLISDPMLKKSLFCTLEEDGESISTASLKILAEFGIILGIDGCPGLPTRGARFNA